MKKKCTLLLPLITDICICNKADYTLKITGSMFTVHLFGLCFSFLLNFTPFIELIYLCHVFDFSAAMIKYNDQNSLQKEQFI